MTAESLQKNQIKGTGRPVPFHTLRSAAVRLTIYFLTLMTTSLSVFSKNLPIQKDHHFKNSTTPKFNRHRPLGKKRSKTNGIKLAKERGRSAASPFLALNYR